MLKNKILLLLAAITGIVSVNAQSLNSSPYTRYGLGDQVKLTSTPFIGMGGASIAMSSYRYINFANPATYGTVIRYNPIFDAGFMGKTSNLNTESSSYNSATVALRNFSLLMPISKRTGFVIGLMPYSNTGYDITNQDPNDANSYILSLTVLIRSRYLPHLWRQCTLTRSLLPTEVTTLLASKSTHSLAQIQPKQKERPS
jgi:hypothetical protein